MLRRGSLQQRSQQRVVGASEEQNIGVFEALGKSLAEIDARDLFGYIVVDPSLFDQWYEQGAGFLMRRQPPGRQRFVVCMAGDSRLGANDDGFPVDASLGRRFRARFDDANDRHMRG